MPSLYFNPVAACRARSPRDNLTAWKEDSEQRPKSTCPDAHSLSSPPLAVRATGLPAHQAAQTGAQGQFRLPGPILPELLRDAIRRSGALCSSGRTALMEMIVAAATAVGGVTALIDFANALPPVGTGGGGGFVQTTVGARVGPELRRGRRI